VRGIFLLAKDHHFTTFVHSILSHGSQNKSPPTNDDLAVYIIPTKFDTPAQEQVPTKVIDTTSLKNEEDLELLKEEDPFLYYSIPSVRKAEFEGTDINISSIKASASKIERKSRVSFECYPDPFDLVDYENLDEVFDSTSLEFDQMLKLLGIEEQ